LPSIERHQVGQHLFQGDAMKRIIGLRRIHWSLLPNVVTA
jgi:hypothetical protein